MPPPAATLPIQGSAPPADLPADVDLLDDSDQPIRFSYVCGNRFLIANAYSVPVSVSWRVIGTDEDGSETLPAAPEEDPSVSEVQVETVTRGPVSLQHGLPGRYTRRRGYREGESHPAGIGHPRVRHEPALPDRRVHSRRDGVEGGCAHQPEADTAGTLHAVHLEWGGSTVGGRDHSDLLNAGMMA